jgi:hypothetical protein
LTYRHRDVTGEVSGVNPERSLTRRQAVRSFQTIWPGWYTSRAIHIHVRVRQLSSPSATIAGYTTQIFFYRA